jgi:catechol 2,3-dioxygenase-like lactoylglutathione lyase family enzyme
MICAPVYSSLPGAAAFGGSKVTTVSSKYNVGGVMLDRPFKIRRLGHFGFNGVNMEECWRFYVDLLGFKVSQPTDGGGFFGRHNGDHHSFVVFNRQIIDERLRSTGSGPHMRPENDINQITWQVQSLNEVWQGTKYFKDLELEVRTEGRAPTGVGSNYHLYVWDPDDQINELFWGMEQIGWDGKTKPREMGRREPVATMEPHISEYAEVQDDIAKGIDPFSGYRYIEPLPEKYNVDDFLLARPFKVVRVGPVNLFVDDLDANVEYYRDVLGLSVTEEVEWQGDKCTFLRCDMEHHSLGLFPKSWRERLGLSPATSNMSFGVQVANYRQLKDAVSFLREHGVRVETGIIPPQLYPGIDYAAFAFDPDGHCIMLYYSMEQLGWSGQPRPKHLRRQVDPNNWPETLEPMSDTFSGEIPLGPWG